MDPGRGALSDDERREVLYRTLDRLRTAAGIRDPDVELAGSTRPRPTGWRRLLHPGPHAAALLATTAARSGRPPGPFR